MKIFIALLLTLAVVRTQAPVAPNTMTVCVSELVKNIDEVLGSGTDYLNGNTLAGIAKMIEAFGDLSHSFEDCKKINMNDAFMWIDQHTDQAQKDCMSKVISGLMAIKGAQAAWNDVTKSTADKLKAWGTVTGLLDTAWQQCTVTLKQ
jgi:hypothetical protein